MCVLVFWRDVCERFGGGADIRVRHKHQSVCLSRRTVREEVCTRVLMTGCQWRAAASVCVCVRVFVCVSHSPGSPGCVHSPGPLLPSCTSPPPLPSSCIRLRREGCRERLD